MKRIKLFLSGFISCLYFQSVAFAASGPYLGVGGGDLFYHVSGNNKLSTGEAWPDDDYTGSRISNQGYGVVAVGYAWERPKTWLPNYSVGLRYLYAPNTTVSGYIDQYSLPEFRNYRFSYAVEMLTLLATVKANVFRWRAIMPYVLVGAGVANFSTSDYNEDALSDVTPRVSPGFGDDSGNNFAYQLGVGVDYALLENLLINLEFNYLHFGTIYTGKGADYRTLTDANYDNERLKNKLAATSVFLGFTYFIG